MMLPDGQAPMGSDTVFPQSQPDTFLVAQILTKLRDIVLGGSTPQLQRLQKWS